MHGNIARSQFHTTLNRLKQYPAVALLGARQVGKSTLAKEVCALYPGAIYLDLERNSDLNKLTDPEVFFHQFENRLICLDEIQRLPEIFPSLRSEIDRKGRPGQFLILGSASRDLIRQSSESLAGRLTFLELTPFTLPELQSKPGDAYQEKHWLRGGYPESLLTSNDDMSTVWREDYIRSFLERDIPQLGFSIPASTLGRFWRMLAHCHGQLLNSAKLASSMGVSSHTIRRYIDLLTETFVVRALLPYESNTKKRLVKSPKTYIRDSGILHALLDIETFEDLFAHPNYGASYEGYVIENVLAAMPRWRSYFYRSANGAEIDLVLERGAKKIAIEIKASAAPAPTRGFYNALEDIEPTSVYVVGLVKSHYPLTEGISVVSLSKLLEIITST